MGTLITFMVYETTTIPMVCKSTLARSKTLLGRRRMSGTIKLPPYCIWGGLRSGIHFRAKWWLEYILDRPNTLLLSGEECVRHSCSHQLIVGECPKIVVISYEDSHSVISMTAIILNSSLKMLTWRRSVYHGWSPPQSLFQELPSEEKWISY